MAAALLKVQQLFTTKLPTVNLNKSLLFITWPYLAILAAHAIWGVNFVVAKLTLQEIPPMSLAFVRFALAGLLLIPFILIEKDQIKISRKDLPALFAIGVLMSTLNISLFYLGLSKTTATTASVLTMAIPMFSVLAAWWFFKEKIYFFNLFGTLLGLLGAGLVIGIPVYIFGTSLFSEAILGNLLIILASACWVTGAMLSKKMLQKYSTLTLTAIVFFVGMVTFAIPAASEYMQNPTWIFKLSSLGIFGIVYIAILSSLSAYFLFEWGLGKIGVVKADLFQYLEPVIAAALGILLLAEQIRFTFIIGALLIGLGVYWSTLAKNHHKHHKAHRT